MQMHQKNPRRQATLGPGQGEWPGERFLAQSARAHMKKSCSTCVIRGGWGERETLYISRGLQLQGEKCYFPPNSFLRGTHLTVSPIPVRGAAVMRQYVRQKRGPVNLCSQHPGLTWQLGGIT